MHGCTEEVKLLDEHICLEDVQCEQLTNAFVKYQKQSSCGHDGGLDGACGWRPWWRPRIVALLRLHRLQPL